MSKLIVMGVDPGIHSLGMCVVVDGRVKLVYQAETPRSKRASLDPHRWVDVFSGCLADAAPHVVGIEGVEPQPWVANGKVPKGVRALQDLVNEMKQIAELHNIYVFDQSPNIQANYPDAVVNRLIKSAMGERYSPLPHLRSAVKHALEAEAKAMRARGRMER